MVALDPSVRPIVVTGISRQPDWLNDPDFDVHRIPSLTKDAAGRYVNAKMSPQRAVEQRGRLFTELIVDREPTAIVVDRHPLGIAGELRRGLSEGHRRGAAISLGLRDVLDEPFVVRREFGGYDWRIAPGLFDQVVVYGSDLVCDHQREYQAPYTPRYCGWVVDAPSAHVGPVDPQFVVVTAGGGGDGDDIVRLGREALAALPDRRGLIVAGPFAQSARHDAQAPNITVVESVPSCADLYAIAGASLQMAGYNSTAEALVAGVRPLLMPRRSPRREQAIRAGRLAALGLADVVDYGTTAEELVWCLQRPRRLGPAALADVGINVDGAFEAAAALLHRRPVAA
jgi:predicted glycosyltransferase